MPVIIEKKNAVLTSALDVAFTRITATKPNTVTKQFSLKPDGTLQKVTTAYVSAGTMETISVKDLTGFAEILQNLETNQCLAYGATGHDKVGLMTEKAWALAGRPDTAVPRTAKHMHWPAKGGVLMLDYDPPKEGKPLTSEEIIAQLKSFCPWLADVAMLWWPSTSSCIFLGDKELSGIKGQRIYIMVKSANDIPRLGRVINTQLWANGIGHFEVSKSGSLLERALFDSSVWQTNRIDFAAGAKCHDDLEQKRGTPQIIPGDIGELDSLKMVPNPNPEVMQMAEANKAKAGAEKLEAAGKKRKEWVAARVEELTKKSPAMPKEHAESTVQRAVEHHVLMGDWILYVQYGDTLQLVSVSHILAHKNEFDKCETLDPLEPDYDGARVVGQLYLLGATPRLHSFAHGGTTFTLIRQPANIVVTKGKMRDATDAAVKVLKQTPNIFDFGSGVVLFDNNGKLLVLDTNSLSWALAGFAQFFSRKVTKGVEVEVLIDPPSAVCSNILALRGIRGLNKLNAIITAPTLRPDGSVLLAVGYDAETGLLFDSEDIPPMIPDNPNKDQAAAAFTRLWMPFGKFPFVSSLDRAACLAAILTAAVRTAFSTSPGFGFDAPTPSSGKTLLARCIAIIATGAEPGTFPNTSGKDDEMRKRIFSVLLGGGRIIFLDNIVGTFASTAMAALLTSDFYQDRVMGGNDVPIVPNRALVLLTGNNLTLNEDLLRRFFIARIDPQVEQPYARQFNLDPAAYCLEHRQQMVADALTLIRFKLSSGIPPLGKGSLGSFEKWDSWIRQTILYVDKALALNMFDDVMKQVDAHQSADPGLESLGQLLQAWHNLYDSKWLAVHTVMEDYNAGCGPVKTPEQMALALALNDLHVGTQKLSSTSLGRLLMIRKGRPVGGLRLEQNKADTSVSKWRVFVLPKAVEPT